MSLAKRISMRLWFCQGLLAVLILVGGRLAQADSDPAYQEKLEKEQVQIDAAVVQAGGTIAKKLSDMFHIKPDLIQEIRDDGTLKGPSGGPGWGEISVLLCMARQLRKQHAADYPTYLDALEKVRSLKSENVSYEDIAKRFEFNLQPVLDETRRIKTHLQSNKRFR